MQLDLVDKSRQDMRLCRRSSYTCMAGDGLSPEVRLNMLGAADEDIAHRMHRGNRDPVFGSPIKHRFDTPR